MINDRDRYLRQISLAELGEEGQKKLSEAKVLVVGVGGLGSPLTTLLVSSGVGQLGIVDFDVVSLSNLPRQTLYTEDDLGLAKVECAARRLRALNSSVQLDIFNCRFDADLAEKIVGNYDVVVDGTDNPQTRYLIDEFCEKYSIPYIYGAISGFVGQVSVFHHAGAGAYSDLFPKEDAPETSPPAVMAVTPAVVAGIEANEVFKVIVGYGNSLSGRLLTIDLRDYSFSIFDV